MKKEHKNIELGQGLGLVKFGMLRDQVVAILGEPDEKVSESLTEGADGQSEIWHYDALDISVGFDEEEKWRLVSIAVSSEYYLFEGKPLVGKSRDEVENVLEDSVLTDLEMDDLSSNEENNQCLLVSEDAEINFWFEADVLSEIQWGPLFEDDDTILWPTL